MKVFERNSSNSKSHGEETALESTFFQSKKISSKVKAKKGLGGRDARNH